MNDNKKTVIIINGNGGCGKDTFVKSIQELFPGIINVSVVDPIYEMAKIAGWDGVTKESKDRIFLHKLKMLSEEYNDCPNRYILSRFDEFINNEEESIMFVHAREVSNIKHFVEEMNKSSKAIVKTLLISRPSYDVVWGNEADDGVDNYDYNYIFINDERETEEEIKQAAIKFFTNCILGYKFK